MSRAKAHRAREANDQRRVDHYLDLVESYLLMAQVDDDIARLMDEALARRNHAVADDWAKAGYYEKAFRVLGRYMDEQKPRDTFFFEQDGAFVVRLLMPSPTGSRHVLAEFTREDIDAMIAQGPALRDPEHGKGKAAKADA